MDDHDETLPALAEMLAPPADLTAILAAADAAAPARIPDELEGTTAFSFEYTGEPWPGITSDDVAEWALSKLAAVDAAIEARKAHADALMARIDNWFHAEMEKRQGQWPSLRQQRAFFAAHLEAYARAQRDEKDRKTISLVSGEIATREQKARLVVEDEEALVDWACHEAPDLVRTRVDVPVSWVQKAIEVTADGEVVLHDWDPDEVQKPDRTLDGLPPGVAIEPEHVTVTVKPR